MRALELIDETGHDRPPERFGGGTLAQVRGPCLPLRTFPHPRSCPWSAFGAAFGRAGHPRGPVASHAVRPPSARRAAVILSTSARAITRR
ncbi:Hypothetical protein A7982_09801 [Minicystis rosea]|nr:Hypothetical protein A7982_09801 [Minicystis rosea]